MQSPGLEFPGVPPPSSPGVAAVPVDCVAVSVGAGRILVARPQRQQQQQQRQQRALRGRHGPGAAAALARSLALRPPPGPAVSASASAAERAEHRALGDPAAPPLRAAPAGDRGRRETRRWEGGSHGAGQRPGLCTAQGALRSSPGAGAPLAFVPAGAPWRVAGAPSRRAPDPPSLSRAPPRPDSRRLCRGSPGSRPSHPHREGGPPERCAGPSAAPPRSDRC